jgi:hypothetical protein
MPLNLAIPLVFTETVIFLQGLEQFFSGGVETKNALLMRKSVNTSSLTASLYELEFSTTSEHTLLLLSQKGTQEDPAWKLLLFTDQID